MIYLGKGIKDRTALTFCSSLSQDIVLSTAQQIWVYCTLYPSVRLFNAAAYALLGLVVAAMLVVVIAVVSPMNSLLDCAELCPSLVVRCEWRDDEMILIHLLLSALSISTATC
jgi:hypothetical protein